jgi:hypothetical protein
LRRVGDKEKETPNRNHTSKVRENGTANSIKTGETSKISSLKRPATSVLGIERLAKRQETNHRSVSTEPTAYPKNVVVNDYDTVPWPPERYTRHSPKVVRPVASFSATVTSPTEISKPSDAAIGPSDINFPDSVAGPSSSDSAFQKVGISIKTGMTWGEGFAKMKKYKNDYTVLIDI